MYVYKLQQNKLQSPCCDPIFATGLTALQVLKQKKLYENQRGQLMNQQFNVDQTSFALQSMQDSVQTVQAMKAAGKELKAAFKQPELNINSIENLQDDMADMMVGGAVSQMPQFPRCLMVWCATFHATYMRDSVSETACHNTAAVGHQQCMSSVQLGTIINIRV